MEHLEVPQFLGLLAIALASAKLFGFLAKRIGQPAVLGELLAGVILGTSVLGLVNSKNEVFHLLAELGVVILLFEIGLETDLRKLLKVGGTSTVVAVVGVALPFVLGYLVCRLLGLSNIVAVVAGASLTATSVGITARVFSDLGRLQEPESQIVLGAAVIDDVIGLIILTVVAGLVQGQEITFLGAAKMTGVAFGFLAVVLLVGSLTDGISGSLGPSERGAWRQHTRSHCGLWTGMGGFRGRVGNDYWCICRWPTAGEDAAGP